MKLNVLLLTAILGLSSIYIQAQRGVRIGYIDTEYILENVPEYQDAVSQLDAKVQKWKGEIESKLSVVDQKRQDLSNEKALLTAELIKEREEDITFEEKEILDYQQKRFGPNGDLIIQKKQLMQPVQDQIFAAVQDIAAKKKYDFVFDKSADVVMLYSAQRFDISEQVLRAITRTAKRKQVQSRAERKKAEQEELVPEINEELEARKKALEEKKTARAEAAEQRRKEILEAREARKKEAEARRQKVIEERKKAREEKINARNKANTQTNKEDNTNESAKENEEEQTKTKEELLEERRQKKLAEREARKKALEEKRKKILEEREKARKEKTKQQQQQNNENEDEDEEENEDENNNN